MKKLKILFILLILLPFNIKAYETSAYAAILMDQNSKRIIYSKNIHTVRSVASISKIMTAIVAIENGNLKEKVEIGNEIDSATGSAIYIKKGEVLTLEDLLYGLMLRSGNDAALAIAKNIGGSLDKFVIKMNELAKKIGMKNTTFNNPHGLDSPNGNMSTAYDMAILTSYAMQNKTYQKIVKTKTYKVKTNKNTYVWHNKNRLLKNDFITGGKTGFTDIARRTLVSTASKNNLNLVVVTLNDGNDFNDHMSLYDNAYKEFNNYKILDKNNLTIYDEDYYEDYSFYLKKDFYYPLTNSEKDNISLKIKLTKKRDVKNNDKVGSIDVYLADQKIYTDNVYVKQIEKKQGIFSRIINWFKNLW